MPAYPRPRISVGPDARLAALGQAIPQAIFLRANGDVSHASLGEFEVKLARREPLKRHPGRVHELALSLKDHSYLGMFKQYLRALGCSGLDALGPSRLAELMQPRELRREFPKFAALAESTTDFPSLTLDAINKGLRYFYTDAPKQWPAFCHKGTNPDFKNINRVAISESPTLVQRKAGQEIQYVTLGDSKEVYVLQEYIAGIRLTRQVVINDDLSAFAAIPKLQANAAARLEDDVAFAVLTTNPTMADGGALFNSTAYAFNVATNAPNGGHQNLITGPYPVSIAGLNAAKTAMKKQKGPRGVARLELNPATLLVPTSVEAVAEQMLLSERIIPLNTTAGQLNQGEVNPFYKKLDILGSTRLDDYSTLNWFLAADPMGGQVSTIEICFLSNEQDPVVKSETDFDTDDQKFAIRHTVAAAALDFRGLIRVTGQ